MKVTQQRRMTAHVKLHNHSSIVENTASSERPQDVEKHECAANTMQIDSWQSKSARVSTSPVRAKQYKEDNQKYLQVSLY